MNAVLPPNPASWSSTHPITAEDKIAMAALRAMVEPLKGKLQGTAARQPFDAIMERVPAPEGGVCALRPIPWEGSLDGGADPARRNRNT
jgi:hypothetical protein